MCKEQLIILNANNYAETCTRNEARKYDLLCAVRCDSYQKVLLNLVSIIEILTVISTCWNIQQFFIVT
jgi:hypothetical protein